MFEAFAPNAPELVVRGFDEYDVTKNVFLGSLTIGLQNVGVYITILLTCSNS